MNVERVGTIASFIGYSGGGGAIEVAIAQERSSLLEGLPSWVAGYAQPSAGVVVLIPSRSVSYPDDTLEETYLHELAHVFQHRAAGGSTIPRWFNEGVAVVAGRSWTLEDRTRMAWESIASRGATGPEVDRMFFSDERSVRRAYAVSEAFVRDAMRRYGSETIALIFRYMNGGASFEQAFGRATGRTVERAWTVFWQSQGLARIGIGVLASSAALWFAIVVISIAAVIRKRRQTQLQLRIWQLEDELEELRRQVAQQREEEDHGPVK